MSQKTSKPKATAKTIRKLFAELSNKQQIDLIARLILDTGYTPHPVEDPAIAARKAMFDREERDRTERMHRDPIPNLKDLAGVRLHPRDKWHLPEAAYLMGCLANEGAIAFEPPVGTDEDPMINFSAGVRVLSRALFNLESDLPIEDLDSGRALFNE